MQLLFFSFALALVLVACSGQHIPDEILRASQHRSLPHVVRNRLSLSLRADNRDSAQCQEKARSCADCRTVRECAYLGSAYVFLRTTACPDSAPFCDGATGSCVAQSPEPSSDATCVFPARSHEFTCYDGDDFQGYFPAPFDCGKYYVCANSAAYVYNCPGGLQYDHRRAECVAASPDVCSPFPCSSNVGEYLLYGPDHAVYAYCASAGTALVSKCRPSYRINPARPNDPCKPFCSSAGRIADAEDPRGYFECFDGGNSSSSNSSSSNSSADASSWNAVQQWCPQGMVFSEALQRCVLSSAQAAVTTLAPSTSMLL